MHRAIFGFATLFVYVKGQLKEDVGLGNQEELSKIKSDCHLKQWDTLSVELCATSYTVYNTATLTSGVPTKTLRKRVRG